ncbi:hypothetical protein [Cyanobium sp. NIES-981]|uniref:hypothetical protein n=1 Tax=Cyanobium sp. NIES-981 TaxID=1851505 RepID=UPI0007DCF83F|nr:hypothetical protein [Cyanobium sp. NIES-981]SBO44902.1 conserved membrane protein of unknown function [Cyanobium sp. NIES-981]
MASPAAYEPPTVTRAWQAFLTHVPTMLLIWVATAVISGMGFGIYVVINVIAYLVAGGQAMSEMAEAVAMALGQLGQLPFSILSSLVGVLFTAVPALHYASGETIGIEAAFQALFRRPWRYLLAGLLFSLVTVIGLLLCVLPGIAVALVGPVYVNKVFNTDLPVLETLRLSFQAVYRSPRGWEFVGIELLTGLVVAVVSVVTCGLGALVAVPVSSFYIQNVAYHRGVLS